MATSGTPTDAIGLDWIGFALDWIGLDWVGFGLDWIGFGLDLDLDRIGLDKLKIENRVMEIHRNIHRRPF